MRRRRTDDLERRIAVLEAEVARLNEATMPGAIARTLSIYVAQSGRPLVGLGQFPGGPGNTCAGSRLVMEVTK